MANLIKIKRSAVEGKVPLTTDLELGELALNTYDGKLYTKKDDGTPSIVDLSAGGGLTYTESNTAPTSPQTGDEWLDTSSGILYTYVSDTDGSQWVELGPKWTSSSSGDVTVSSSAADILSASAGEISAVDLGSDKLWGWDSSSNKAIGFTLGTGLSTDGTTLNAAGTASVGIDPVIAGMIF